MRSLTKCLLYSTWPSLYHIKWGPWPSVFYTLPDPLCITSNEVLDQVSSILYLTLSVSHQMRSLTKCLLYSTWPSLYHIKWGPWPSVFYTLPARCHRCLVQILTSHACPGSKFRNKCLWLAEPLSETLIIIIKISCLAKFPGQYRQPLTIDPLHHSTILMTNTHAHTCRRHTGPIHNYI